MLGCGRDVRVHLRSPNRSFDRFMTHIVHTPGGATLLIVMAVPALGLSLYRFTTGSWIIGVVLLVAAILGVICFIDERRRWITHDESRYPRRPSWRDR